MVPFACDSGHGDARCKSKWGFLPKTAQYGRYYRDSERKQTSSRHYFAPPRVSRQLPYLRSSVVDFNLNDFDRFIGQVLQRMIMCRAPDDVASSVRNLPRRAV